MIDKISEQPTSVHITKGLDKNRDGMALEQTTK